ncbi:hypothetical protein [Arthrobacter agilis]|uniref:hypothetical protein n=1 Tax=Arthrobacter agilis TaxID=37921 RepID=UPI00278899FA|nr:hypothetical protein [Arthrobacter agilis]MDQ0734025.1 hypothetical protein [Arthrobacter agilis]
MTSRPSTTPRHRLSTTPWFRPTPRATVQGFSVLVGTALLVTGCSIPGLPGATGAPGPMTRAAEIQGPAATQTADAVSEAVSEAASEAGDDAGTDAPGAAQPDEPAAAGAETPTTDPSASADPDTTADTPSPPGDDEDWVRVKADLDGGSVTHTLPAGGRTVVIDYWTDDDVSRLTPDSTPIIRMNARIDGADDGTHIAVTRFNAQVQRLGVVLANDTGSFAINPPFTYMTAVALPANPEAHATEVLVTFDLLTETAPGSGIMTRQTILDTVSLGYAQPPGESE